MWKVFGNLEPEICKFVSIDIFLSLQVNGRVVAKDCEGQTYDTKTINLYWQKLPTNLGSVLRRSQKLKQSR